MKGLWNSFKVAFAMFSKIPVPPADWTKENMKYMFCFFPFIGTVIGALAYGAFYVGELYLFETSFVAVVLVLIPVLVTGGIHVDGLLDTADALSSWQERERRLEILKDSNAGAFAVITAGIYFLTWYGACRQILGRGDRNAILLLCMGFMVSRCLSALGVLNLPKAKADGTVAEFSRKSADRPVRVVLIIYLVILALIMLKIQPVYACIQLAAAVLVFIYYRHMALKYFGGTTGDLSGYFLCLCEVIMALVLAIAPAFLVL